MRPWCARGPDGRQAARDGSDLSTRQLGDPRDLGQGREELARLAEPFGKPFAFGDLIGVEPTPQPVADLVDPGGLGRTQRSQPRQRESDHPVLAHAGAGLVEQAQHQAADGRPFLHGDRFTETDVQLFVTLIRFDAAYHGLFKCNLRRIADYPGLSGYLKRSLDFPGIRETVSIDHIKHGYYSMKALNPQRIVPLGPDLSELGLSE